MLLLMNTSSSGVMGILQTSQRQFSASWWQGMNVFFGMASQVLKEWWRKRQEGLVSQRCKGFPSLLECHRSEAVLIIHTCIQAKLLLPCRFDTLCSYLPYYEEGTWRGTQQKKFNMNLLQLFPTDLHPTGFLLNKPWTFWHG